MSSELKLVGDVGEDSQSQGQGQNQSAEKILPRCPRCGRSVEKMGRLMDEAGLIHTYICPHEACRAVLGICVDFVMFHAMRGMMMEQEQGQNRIVGPDGVVRRRFSGE